MIWVIFALCLIPELLLSGADMGLWGTGRWRQIAFENGAFWTGLLGNWQPNYTAQPIAMFATYGFLHAGVIHFGVNMITLFSLGPPLVTRLGPKRFALLYTVSLLGGGAGFALLSAMVAPMIGASGALFGLAGALLAHEFAFRRARHRPLWPVMRALLWLVALNAALWWAMNGQLAWETHLGGFLTGAAAAFWWRRR